MNSRFFILEEHKLAQALNDLPGWVIEDGGLKQEFKFKNFKEAFAFISSIAEAAEELNHHPEIFNAYNRVIISGLCTHDAGNAITTLDIELAQQISKLYNK